MRLEKDLGFGDGWSAPAVEKQAQLPKAGVGTGLAVCVVGEMGDFQG